MKIGINSSKTFPSPKRVLLIVTLGHMLQHFTQGISVLYPSIMADLGLNYTQLGLIIAAGSITGGSFQILFTILTRYFQKSFLLGIGTMIISLGFYVMSIATNFLHLLIAKIIWGFGSAAQHPIGSTMISDQYDNKEIGKAFGLHFSLSNIGTLLGPIVMGTLSVTIGWEKTLLLSVIPPLILGVIMIHYLQNSESKAQHELNDVLTDIRSALRIKGAVPIIIAQSLITAGTGWGVIVKYTPLFLVDAINLDIFDMTIVYSIAVSGGIFGPLIIGKLSDRIGHIQSAILATFISSIMIFLLALYDSFSILLVIHLFMLAFTAFSLSGLLQSHISDIVDKKDREMIIGLFYTIGYGSSSISVTIIGFLIDKYESFTPAFFLIAILGIFATIILFSQFLNRRSNNL